MDTMDRNIKKIFSTYTKTVDVDLEESIMDSIAIDKNFKIELQQSRKMIKIGMALSALFSIGYFILTYLDTLPQINNNMKLIDIYLPTMFAALLIIVMFFLMTYSLTSSKNKLIF